MSVGFCGSLNNNFSMSVGCLWDSIYKKESFAMSLGFCGSLNNNFSISVGFCGTPYLLKRYICNVCGVPWDSLLYILKKMKQTIRDYF